VNIGDLVRTVEMQLIEVRGQLAEGGPLLREAVRQLAEAVSLLEEFTEGGEKE
jgi:hypothetical protein